MGEARDNAEREALLSILETDLLRLVPGLGVVDRGLSLARGHVQVRGQVRGQVHASEGRRADLVLLDESGRALIVLVVDGRGDETVLAAIDALAFARASGDALARPTRPLAPGEISARVALVAESFSTRALEGLSVLPERELMLLETRKLASETGSRTRLVRVEALSERGAEPAVSRETFLSTLPEFLRGTADLLLRRLARVDAQIEFAFAEGAVEIRCGERELCVLEVHDGALRGEIPALDHSLPVRGMDDADRLLDEVLREHLRDLESIPIVRPTRSPRPSEEPLLSPEEIAAFRD
jgi:hypothetical protein